jgi:hypothetical protein
MFKQNKHDILNLLLCIIILFSFDALSGCQSEILTKPELENYTSIGTQPSQYDRKEAVIPMSFEDLEAFIRWATVDAIFTKTPIVDDGDDLLVFYATDDENAWAIVVINREGSDIQSIHNGLHLWKVEGSTNNPVIHFVIGSLPALSSGLTAEVREFEGKYLLYGSIGPTHTILGDPASNEELSLDNSLIDLTQRSYITIDTEACMYSISCADKLAYSGYICILDSRPKDLTLYDDNDNELVRLSRTSIEFKYNDFCSPLGAKYTYECVIKADP